MAVFCSKRGLPRSAGFSLVEIITVLAIIGLAAGVLIGGSSAMMRSFSSDDIEQAALSAIAEVRHQSVLKGRPLVLSYDEEKRLLQWEEGQATLVGEDGIRLLPPVRTSSVLIGGKLVETPITRVRFYPDGTCDPFRLEIIRGRNSKYLGIDPWTCAALAGEDEKAK